jgi:hypothetical protein
VTQLILIPNNTIKTRHVRHKIEGITNIQNCTGIKASSHNEAHTRQHKTATRGFSIINPLRCLDAGPQNALTPTCRDYHIAASLPFYTKLQYKNSVRLLHTKSRGDKKGYCDWMLQSLTENKTNRTL